MTARHRDTTVPLGCSRLPQSPDGGRHRLGRIDADGELILSLREALDRSLAASAKKGPSMSMPLRLVSDRIRWHGGWRFFGDADPSVGREMQVGDGWTDKAGVTRYWTEQGWA